LGLTVVVMIRTTIGALVAAVSIATGWTAAQAPSSVRLKYLGTAGWEISDGRTVALIDPYLSRLRMTTPNDDVRPGDPSFRRAPRVARRSASRC